MQRAKLAAAGGFHLSLIIGPLWLLGKLIVVPSTAISWLLLPLDLLAA
jgi:hypothetical protein